MFDSIKKFIFFIYLFSTRFENLLIKKITYKFGIHIVRKLGTSTYTVNGAKFRLSPLNMIDKLILSGKGHDVEVENEIRSCLKDGGLFLDIGANWGYFSIMASKMKNVDVLSFEPSKKEQLKLYDHIILNQSENITVFPFGLSDRLSVQKLFYGPERNSGTNSVLIDNNSGSCESIFAPINPFIPREYLSRIKVCKIDVEGFELFVLNGMRDVMPYLTCSFIIEITPQYLAKANHEPKDIYNFFNEFNYKSRHALNPTGQYDEIFYKI